MPEYQKLRRARDNHLPLIVIQVSLNSVTVMLQRLRQLFVLLLSGAFMI
jgi:hypothetical protein